MSYATQPAVNKRLSKQSLSELHALRDKKLMEIARIWGKHRHELQLAIMQSYRRVAPAGKWTLSRFKYSGQFMALSQTVRGIMSQFDAVSKTAAKKSLNEIYRQSALRHAWILDQVTPDSRDVRIPNYARFHEAAATATYIGEEAARKWAERWSQWTDSYQSALLQNIAHGALNESAIEDAVSEVDATKSNTPQAGLWDSIARIFDYEATYSIAAGGDTIADMNDDLLEVEIWKTRDDLNVCDDCAANEGLPIDEADGTIPLHPNCHCYPLLVPESYAELLRSGDSDDRALARDMDRRGIAPNALVIRNEDGDIAAKMIVSFPEWTQGNAIAVSTLQ